jgi:hypothetical protein
MFSNGILLILTLIPLRLSICWFFLRITFARWQRYTVYCIAAICMIVQIMNVFWTTIFYCNPIRMYWDTTITYGSCVSNHTLSTLYYLQYSTDTVSDWTLSILPMYFIIKANMNIRVKVITLCLTSIGIVASISSILCIVFTPQVVNTEDYVYTSYHFFAIQPIEPFVGILATSYATFRPLFRRLLEVYHTRTRSTTVGGSKAHQSTVEDLERHRTLGEPEDQDFNLHNAC